jgi:hypothetical protein
MRKFLLLFLSSAMLIGGLYLVYFELLFAHPPSVRFIIGGAILVVVAGYLLWEDFIAPRLGIKTWED